MIKYLCFIILQKDIFLFSLFSKKVDDFKKKFPLTYHFVLVASGDKEELEVNWKKSVEIIQKSLRLDELGSVFGK